MHEHVHVSKTIHSQPEGSSNTATADQNKRFSMAFKYIKSRAKGAISTLSSMFEGSSDVEADTQSSQVPSTTKTYEKQVKHSSTRYENCTRK